VSAESANPQAAKRNARGFVSIGFKQEFNLEDVPIIWGRIWNSPVWPFILQAVLIAINAFCAASEIALISFNRTLFEKQAREGDKKAETVLSITRRQGRFLAAIQVLITLSGFLGSAFAANNFTEKFSAAFLFLPISRDGIRIISVVLITLILSFITLILGELVPKQLALHNADSLARVAAPVIGMAAKLSAPVISLLTFTTNAVLKLFKIDAENSEETITEADIRLLVDAGHEKGAIEKSEQEIIHNLFAFDDKSAGDIITHRTDLVFLYLTDDDDVWRETIMNTRHSYYPVCGDSEDDIRYILSTRLYFRLKTYPRGEVLSGACAPPKFIPNTVKLDVLFRNMKKTRIHFAVVLDEYGSTLGVVTINDLLEELVGDLDDDINAGPDKPLIEKSGNGVFRVQGGCPLDKAAEAFGLPLPDGGFDTFGGFVFAQLGRVPDDGEVVDLETPRLLIHVASIKDHRIVEAIVKKIV
jgi:putative hemolysin